MICNLSRVITQIKLHQRTKNMQIKKCNPCIPSNAWCPFDRYDPWKSASDHITVDDPNDRNDPCDCERWNRIRFYSSDRLSDHNDSERSKRSHGHGPAIVIFPKVHCTSGSFHADFDFAPKNKILGVFWTIRTIEWTLLSDRRDRRLLDDYLDRYDRNDQMDTRKLTIHSFFVLRIIANKCFHLRNIDNF